MKEQRRLIMLPGPTNVPDRVTRAMTNPIINHRGPEFGALYDSISEGLKHAYQTKHDVYVLTCSGTGAVECSISNILNPGDKVVVPVYGVFSERLKEKAALHRGQAVEVSIEWGDVPTAEQIAEVVEKEKGVKAIAVVYNETSTGATVRDLPKIGEIAKENDLILVVDAISILGGDYLPVDDWGVDLCVSGSQKCLACPPGLATISVSEKAWEAIEKTKVRPYYFDLVKTREYGSRKETPFTPALPLYYALDEALKMIREEGLENRFKRHATCAKAFYAALEAMKLKPYPREEARSNTVIAISVPAGVDGAKVRDAMKERYNVVTAGGMGKIRQLIFRVGCMGIVSESEILTTVSALESALSDVNYPVKIGAGVEAARRVFQS